MTSVNFARIATAAVDGRSRANAALASATQRLALATGIAVAGDPARATALAPTVAPTAKEMAAAVVRSLEQMERAFAVTPDSTAAGADTVTGATTVSERSATVRAAMATILETVLDGFVRADADAEWAKVGYLAGLVDLNEDLDAVVKAQHQGVLRLFDLDSAATSAFVPSRATSVATPSGTTGRPTGARTPVRRPMRTRSRRRRPRHRPPRMRRWRLPPPLRLTLRRNGPPTHSRGPPETPTRTSAPAAS